MSLVLGLRPFVPAKQFALSIRFYEALGFVASFKGEEIAVFAMEGCGFVLQDFYAEELARNLMIQLLVADVDAWWARLDGAALVAEFGVQAPRAPVLQPWGMKVGFVFDPSGVLWHVTETGSPDLKPGA